ncbi:MAG: hypothetical protein JXQ90_06990 [Cyclobacteriaceae bacterium]
MIRLIVSLLLLCLHQLCLSQVAYVGKVHDVAVDQPLSDVLITLKGQELFAVSDADGNFSIRLERGAETDFRVFHNTLFWESSESFQLLIHDLQGKKLLDLHPEPAVGMFTIPDLSPGLYVLQVISVDRYLSYKIIANQLGTLIADQSADWIMSRLDRMDTLVFSKEGYPTRTLILAPDSYHQVGMISNTHQDVDYFNELIDPLAFELLSSSPSRTNYGNVRAVKFIYDAKEDLLYYMNSEKYVYHYHFAEQVLKYNQGHAIFNYTQYSHHPDRYLYMGSINYYAAQDRYVMQFVTGNKLYCEEVEMLYDKISSSSFFAEELLFFPIKDQWGACDLPSISSDELYEGQNYQALNHRINYGYLRKLSLEELESTYVGRRDIVLLDGIPNDLPVVAGIITTEFQTPLSHINMLSHSRGTPNMALRDGWDRLDSLADQLVYLNVDENTYEIRKASIEDAELFWAQTEPGEPIVLEQDLAFSELIEMESADHTYVSRIGGKAANFGELMNIQVGGNSVPVPEGAFAIPFHFYDAHMKTYGLDVLIDSLLQLEQFRADPVFRQQQLSLLRDSIVNSPIDPRLIEAVNVKIGGFSAFPSYRFRSSTNAEDLELFSGAGLYDSKSAKRDHTSKTIDNAIKTVWASLWNWRAFEERSYFRIDHQSCAMGILVHRSFPDEDANGVLVTKNLYNENDGFIINVQYKEESIVFPKPGVIHDQLILFTWSPDFGEEFMIEYLTFSNVPELGGNHVMRDEELFELGQYAKAIRQHFYYNVPHHCSCSLTQFGVDIEFKVDSDVSSRKLYIKQARLYR